MPGLVLPFSCRKSIPCNIHVWETKHHIPWLKYLKIHHHQYHVTIWGKTTCPQEKSGTLHEAKRLWTNIKVWKILKGKINHSLNQKTLCFPLSKKIKRSSEVINSQLSAIFSSTPHLLKWSFRFNNFHLCFLATKGGAEEKWWEMVHTPNKIKYTKNVHFIVKVCVFDGSFWDPIYVGLLVLKMKILLDFRDVVNCFFEYETRLDTEVVQSETNFRWKASEWISYYPEKWHGHQESPCLNRKSLSKHECEFSGV